MKILPKAKCPKCGGPISFWDVASILTPLQSTNCATCGEMVFLRQRWELLWASVGLAGVTFALVMFGMILRLASDFTIYSGAVLLIIVAEYVVTRHVVKHKGLVIRKED